MSKFVTKNIILLGMMGSGKSTIGELLAKKLQLNFIDSDKEIEVLLKKSIKTIFETEGESFFREKESEFLLELQNKPSEKFILSTGGGMVLKESNRAILKSLGFNVWLKASAETIYERLQNETQRPLLTGHKDFKSLNNSSNSKEENLKNRIDKILAEREELYQQTADFIIEVDKTSPEEICERLINHLKEL